MISEKYLAGFLDSDGGVSFYGIHDNWKPGLNLTWSQKTEQDEVLKLIQKDYGGKFGVVNIKGSNYSHLTLINKQASKILYRIKKHLVIKRYFVEFCLDASEHKVSNVKEFKSKIKEQRRIKSLPIPNYPSRKWLAGYLDGDGCFSIRYMGKQGGCNPILHVACADYDTEGIEVIHKAYGGAIHDMRNGKCRQMIVSLNPSKMVQMFYKVAKYMVVKQDQAQFLLSCAKMGHYRDGKFIKDTLKQLKTQPHRLNEPRVDIHELLKQVKDLPSPWSKNGRMVCIGCGTTKSKHMGNGLCSACYQRERRRENRLMRQSVAA